MRIVCLLVAGAALLTSPWWMPDGVRARVSEAVGQVVAGAAHPASAREVPSPGSADTDPN